MTPDETADHASTDTKALRAEHPSGWLLLTKSETVPYVVDALLEAPPGWEFNQTQLAESAGVHRNSLSKFLGLLVRLRVIKEVEDTQPTRYRLDMEGPVTQELFHLNSAVNSVGFDEDPEIDGAEVAPTVHLFSTPMDQGSGSETRRLSQFTEG